MSEKKRIFFSILLNLIALNGIVLAIINLRYPLIGHDYTYSIPSFLDSAIHYRFNGLAIQWFTPTFGGGIPAFPNPNHMQYSIPSMLASFLPPWTAMMISVVLYISAGFLAAYYFLHSTIKLHWTSSVLGALFFSANGFVITRMATGQLGYFTFPLLPLFLILLLDKRLSVGITAALFGLLLAKYIYSGGYFIIIIHVLSILMLLPLLYLLKPDLLDWKRLLPIIVLGGVIGMIISASKLAATFSFMRYFPRLIADHYPVSFFVGLLGILLQLLGTQTLVPVFMVAGLDPSTYPNLSRAASGTHYGMWELDTSITPAVFIIILVFMIQFVYNAKQYFLLIRNNRQRIALLMLVFFTWLAIEFALAKGFLYPELRKLPILSSLRGNVRFAGTFVFPLAFLAVVIYNHWAKPWVQKKLIRTYLAVNLLAVLPLFSYFLFDQDMFRMFYDIAGPQRIYEEIRAGNSFEISEIGTPKGENTGALLYRTSNLNLYEPVFGFRLENFHPEVEPGSIWSTSDGYYNMTNPTGYLYPDLNNSQAFELFRIEDKATLELFAKHIQPDWKIPTYQRALNWTSGIGFVATVLWIFIHITLQGYKNRKMPRTYSR
ncbi:MAG TPA: hypothetical protein VFR47_33600 [Anaerolineales bacterium]|nr:hypothetical protein [Anaerolineales bacterium]